jgi:hypothetical protein
VVINSEKFDDWTEALARDKVDSIVLAGSVVPELKYSILFK